MENTKIQVNLLTSHILIPHGVMVAQMVLVHLAKVRVLMG